jgi:hypothetical protein
MAKDNKENKEFVNPEEFGAVGVVDGELVNIVANLVKEIGIIKREVDNLKQRINLNDKPVSLSILKPERTDRMPIGGAPVGRNEINDRR